MAVPKRRWAGIEGLRLGVTNKEYAAVGPQFAKRVTPVVGKAVMAGMLSIDQSLALS